MKKSQIIPFYISLIDVYRHSDQIQRVFLDGTVEKTPFMSSFVAHRQKLMQISTTEICVWFRYRCLMVCGDFLAVLLHL